MNRESALNLLETLTASGRVGRRSRELLRPPDSEAKGDWFMFVPPCFNDALDIKQNYGANPGWTQAGGFAFKPEDTIYDTSKAYQRWGDALKEIHLCVVVKSGASAGAGANSTRYPGSVRFEVLMPTPDKKKLTKRFEYTLTQDAFVRFLIDGPQPDLSAKIDAAASELFDLSS